MLISRLEPFESAFFRAAKWSLWFLGLWPLNPIRPLPAVVIFLHITILLTALVGEYRFTWLIRSQPGQVFTLICPMLIKSVTWVKVVLMVFQRKQIAKLMSELFKHLVEDSKNPEKNAMISRASFFAAVCTLWLLVLGFATSCNYAAKPILMWTYHRFSGGTNGSWIGLPYPLALPYEDMTQVGSKFLYALFFCVSFHSSNVASTGNSAIDGVYLYTCMYISTTYQCLRKDIKDAFQKHKDSLTRTSSVGFQEQEEQACAELYKELRLVVSREQNISVMFQLMNDIYTSIIFPDLFFAGISLGFALLEFLLVPVMMKMMFVAFCAGVATQIFLYCYCAEVVNESRLKFSNSLYACEWYLCKPKVGRLILFFLGNTQRGQQLQMPFITPSLPLFAAVMRTSGSYIALLKTFI